MNKIISHDLKTIYIYKDELLGSIKLVTKIVIRISNLNNQNKNPLLNLKVLN